MGLTDDVHAEIVQRAKPRTASADSTTSAGSADSADSAGSWVVPTPPASATVLAPVPPATAASTTTGMSAAAMLLRRPVHQGLTTCRKMDAELSKEGTGGVHPVEATPQSSPDNDQVVPIVVGDTNRYTTAVNEWIPSRTKKPVPTATAEPVPTATTEPGPTDPAVPTAEPTAPIVSRQPKAVAVLLLSDDGTLRHTNGALYEPSARAPRVPRTAPRTHETGTPSVAGMFAPCLGPCLAALRRWL